MPTHAILHQSVSALGLSVRVVNRLFAARVETVKMLVKLTEEDLRGVRNLGADGVAEILERLNVHGIHCAGGARNASKELPGEARRGGSQRRGYPFLKADGTKPEKP
jgi:DNA-directed RNA polymerase alpha subunit